MFPHPCGEELERAVQAGTSPLTVVPDDYVVVRGGAKPVPPAMEPFSCATGPDLTAAACAVPYNQLRATTAGQIRTAGGVVEWLTEFSQRGTINKQHVHVTELGETVFSDPLHNPVPKAARIDGGK